MIKTAGELISQAQKEISCVDAISAKRLYDGTANAVILDVREANSAAESKLEASTNISRGLLEMKAPAHIQESDTLVLTHCAGGGRASLAALTLNQMGYTNVHAITAKFEDIKEVFG